jgi:hypothetical protein
VVLPLPTSENEVLVVCLSYCRCFHMFNNSAPTARLLSSYLLVFIVVLLLLYPQILCSAYVASTTGSRPSVLRCDSKGTAAVGAWPPI